MAFNDNAPGDGLDEVVEAWLQAFEAALAARDVAAVAALFQDDGIWRDLVALDWHVGTVLEAPAIGAALVRAAEATAPSGFHLAEGRTPPPPDNAGRYGDGGGALHLRNPARAGQRCVAAGARCAGDAEGLDADHHPRRAEGLRGEDR